MILVTVGTNGAAFDRLLVELDDLSPGEEIIVQRGPSAVAPAGASCVDYLPFGEIERLVRKARVVVTHAGVGSTLVAIDAGHHPVVVPRLRSFGEVVDDHQVSFARRLDRQGLVVCCTEPRMVRTLVAISTRVPRGTRLAGGRLVTELSAYLASQCGYSLSRAQTPPAAEPRMRRPTRVG